VTSEYGPRWGRMHRGIDQGASTGTPIGASKAGTVIFAGWQGGYGNLTLIDHHDGVVTAYAHQSRFAVSAGHLRGLQGQTIGYVGNTGNSTGPHLHFETRVNGNAVNPRQYLPQRQPLLNAPAGPLTSCGAANLAGRRASARAQGVARPSVHSPARRGRTLPTMTGEHERYEQLAVGHVLGGLDAADAAEFRTHLLGCRDCRLRVAELRDIAADLAAAERDERAQAQVQTEVARRVEDDEGPSGPDPAPQRIGVRHVTVATVVVLVLAGAMAFWNLHLRTASSTYARVAEYRGDTLRELATGVPVEVELADGRRGAGRRRRRASPSAWTSCRRCCDDERLVVWLVGDGRGGRCRRCVSTRSSSDRGGAGRSRRRRGTQELVITRQHGAATDVPAGDRSSRADLGQRTGRPRSS
jgi:hypothetical protein